LRPGGAQDPRRLILKEEDTLEQGVVPTVWLVVAGTLTACCCSVCCLWRKCSLCARAGRTPKAAVKEGPPPDTHWRCADGGLWWKGASSSSLEVRSDDELSGASEPGPLPRPQSAFEGSEGRPASSPGRMRTRPCSAPPSRPVEARPSTAPAFLGAPDSFNRHPAWDAAFAHKDAPQDPMKPKPPSFHRGFTESPGVGWSFQRPRTPADTAPNMEVDYGVLDKDMNAGEFVQHLRQVRRLTTNADRRKLFKELQLRWHPDKNVGDEVHASEMFKALQDSKSWFLLEERLWTAPGVVQTEMF